MLNILAYYNFIPCKLHFSFEEKELKRKTVYWLFACMSLVLDLAIIGASYWVLAQFASPSTTILITAFLAIFLLSTTLKLIREIIKRIH